jgi:hypothetical protein
VGAKEKKNVDRNEKATIFVQAKHIGCNPYLQLDELFLSMHPYLVSFAMENLKRMLSLSNVVPTST